MRSLPFAIEWVVRSTCLRWFAEALLYRYLLSTTQMSGIHKRCQESSSLRYSNGYLKCCSEGPLTENHRQPIERFVRSSVGLLQVQSGTI